MSQFDINRDVNDFGVRFTKSKWACFSCRTSFSRIRASENKDLVKCPSCGAKSVDMGALFESPKKQNIKKWKIAELISDHGYRYSSPGAVTHINYFLTGNGKLSYKEVEKNILSRINRTK